MEVLVRKAEWVDDPEQPAFTVISRMVLGLGSQRCAPRVTLLCVLEGGCAPYRGCRGRPGSCVFRFGELMRSDHTSTQGWACAPTPSSAPEGNTAGGGLRLVDRQWEKERKRRNESNSSPHRDPLQWLSSKSPKVFCVCSGPAEIEDVQGPSEVLLLPL
ncbi:hypothetical protein DPEC_G00210920 [Dallia pectoralis]|uniref:Uncharacterized protein n=1 Tax=Dallia pectoralis TaxID=75939 RepID=A0ACC2G609_DALPE|nr:hypothetical protein DPEC_G00210920 [Dallia pectoralis]